MSDETLTNADLAAAYKMLEDHEKLWDQIGRASCRERV